MCSIRVAARMRVSKLVPRKKGSPNCKRKLVLYQRVYRIATVPKVPKRLSGQPQLLTSLVTQSITVVPPQICGCHRCCHYTLLKDVESTALCRQIRSNSIKRSVIFRTNHTARHVPPTVAFDICHVRFFYFTKRLSHGVLPLVLPTCSQCRQPTS